MEELLTAKELLQQMDEEGRDRLRALWLSEYDREEREQIPLSAVQRRMTDSAALRSVLLGMSDEEWDTLGKIITAANHFYIPTNSDSFLDLLDMGYLYEPDEDSEEEGLQAVQELHDAVARAKEEDGFPEKRKKRCWLLNCIRAALAIYGVFPFDLLRTMVLQKDGMSLSPGEFDAARKEMLVFQANFLYDKGFLFVRSIDEDLLTDALKSWEEHPDCYYLPDEAAIKANDAMPFVLTDPQIPIFLMRRLMDIEALEMKHISVITYQTLGYLKSGIEDKEEAADALNSILEAVGATRSERRDIVRFTMKRIWPHIRGVLFHGYTREEYKKL